MKITVNDDCKGKWQSWTATLHDDDGFEECCAYGADQEEAITNLRTKVEEAIAQLQAVDFSQVPERVRGDGTPWTPP